MGRILNANGDDFLGPTADQQQSAEYEDDLADLDLNSGTDEDMDQIQTSHEDTDNVADTLLDSDDDTDND